MERGKKTKPHKIHVLPGGRPTEIDTLLGGAISTQPYTTIILISTILGFCLFELWGFLVAVVLCACIFVWLLFWYVFGLV